MIAMAVAAVDVVVISGGSSAHGRCALVTPMMVLLMLGWQLAVRDALAASMFSCTS